MRTTITVEESIYQRIREIAHSMKLPMKTVINLVLAKGLNSLSHEEDLDTFRQITHSMGKPYQKYDLLKALGAASEMEAAEIPR